MYKKSDKFSGKNPSPSESAWAKPRDRSRQGRTFTNPFFPSPPPEIPPDHGNLKRLGVIGVIFVLLAGSVVVGVTQLDILSSSSSPTSVSSIPQLFNPAPVVVTDLPSGEPTCSPAEVIATVSPAVVLVQGQMQGSGVLIDPHGYVVTNAHVVGPMTQVLVSLNENDERFNVLNGQVVGVSPCSDLALIRLPGGTYPALDTPPSKPIERLDAVFKLGYPSHELRQSPVPVPTTGQVNIVSVSRWGIPAVIEHDAVLSKGDSGGPLFNAQGQLIGINVMTNSQTTGMQYSISLDYARQEWQRLRSGGPPIGTRLRPDSPVSFDLDNNIEKRCLVFDGRRDSTITLTVRSLTKLDDPHLALFGPANMLLRDNGVGNWDEKMTLTLDADGVYMAVVNSEYGVNETYAVTLTIQ